ncbi:MAG: response regulator [Candidatus Pacebacteria bacterium]|nr:response regulator [Candidatus Paceibacterota bacterium]
MDRKKIVVIEDEKTLLVAIKSKLKMEGYDVFSAEDGLDGENMVKEIKPDMVLLDILLPSKNGLDILEDLRKEGFNLPVVIISNSGQPVEVDRALKLGAADYLIKADFNPSDVLQKVEKVIGPGEKFIGGNIETEHLKDNVLREEKTVLVIEDDQFLREVVVQKLKREGFDVLSAIDANEAFLRIKEKKPGIMLLDLILPGIDGFEFLSQIKKNPETNKIPVIVLSNLGQKEDVDRAREAGAADYLVKANYTPGEIAKKIREVLKEKYI